MTLEDILKRDDTKLSLAKAHHAYHTTNHRIRGNHYFNAGHRDATCRWCGRTRELVRWDDLPATCAAQPEYQSTESIIAKEEALFERVLDKAKRLAADLNVTTLTGEDLAYMHQTHGVDPSMLEIALLDIGRGLPERLHDEYQVAYAAHRATGAAGQKKTILIAK